MLVLFLVSHLVKVVSANECGDIGGTAQSLLSICLSTKCILAVFPSTLIFFIFFWMGFVIFHSCYLVILSFLFIVD